MIEEWEGERLAQAYRTSKITSTHVLTEKFNVSQLGTYKLTMKFEVGSETVTHPIPRTLPYLFGSVSRSLVYTIKGNIMLR